MRSEGGRQYFCNSLSDVGNAGSLLTAVAGKRPIITYAVINVLTVAAGQVAQIVSSVTTSFIGFEVSAANIGSYPLGRLFFGKFMTLSEGLSWSVTGGAGTYYVLVEGYYE